MPNDFSSDGARLGAVDLGVLILYLALVVGLGCRLAKRSRSTSEFTAAGGRLPGWAVGLSILGTYVSSISFLANPGKSYGANWNPFVFSLTLPLAAWVATRWFVPFYRRTGYVSAYRHLEDRFGVWASLYAVVCYLLTQVARVGTILYLIALPLSQLTGWSIPWIIVGTGTLVTLYTLLGGIEAVIWTDVMQSIVLCVGMVVCVALLITGMPGGTDELLRIAREGNKFSLGEFSVAPLAWTAADPTFWVVLLYGTFINLQNFGIDQSYVQRYLTAESDAAAKRSVWLGALAYIPVSAILFFIGTGLFAFYRVQPELLPADATLKADEIFPWFIATRLPTGVTGLLVAAVLAAAMSSVDSSLNCSATLTMSDFYCRLRPESTEHDRMRVLRIGTIAWGLVGTLTALAMINVRSALDAWWELAGVFSGGMLGLFLLGFLSTRATRPAALTGVSCGVLLILWMTFSRQEMWPESLWANPLHSWLTIVFGTSAILIAGFLTVLLTRRQPAP